MTMRIFRKSIDQSKAAAGPRERPANCIESLHLFVLTTFAVTQPLYDRVGERPMFLADSNIGRAEIAMFTVILSLLLPALVPVALWCAGKLAPRARDPLFAIFVYLLLLFIALPFAKRVEVFLPNWLTIALGLITAGAATWAYFSFRRLKSVVTAAATGIVVFPLLFLFQSPASVLFTIPDKIETASWKPIPVVIVVLDELCGLTLENDEHQIDAARFPHFAELARSATWYRNSTTVFPDTSQALPSLLSGMRPVSSALPGPAELPQNLFSVLKATGDYEFAVFEPISRLAQYDTEMGDSSNVKSLPERLIAIVPTLARVFLVHLAPSEMQPQLPKIPPLWFGLHEDRKVDRQMRRGVFRYVWGDDRRGQFEHFIECIDDAPAPTLYFFHVLMPHVPWCYLPSGRRYIAESNQYELLDFDLHSGKMNFWGTDELFVAQSQQRYLLQLQFVDSQLGQVLARLRSTGLYDKCLLLVTADHGISFRVGMSRREVAVGNAADIMSVPLFVKMPGQQTGSIDDKNVESIDILPSIADALRIKLRLPVDGQSIFDDTLPERSQKTIFRVVHEQLTVPASVLDDRTIVKELRSRFNSSDDSHDVYRIGPHPELLGRNVADLVVADAPATEIELRRFETRYTSDREELVPCYYEGRVISSAPIQEPVPIAVAVNGTIRGVTRTYDFDKRREHWAVLVPEDAFRVGDNDVQFYVISGQSPQLRLTRCRVQANPKFDDPK